MKINFLLIVISLIQVTPLWSQNILLGLVNNEQNRPIIGAKISQVPGDFEKIANTDKDGIFHLLLDKNEPNNIIVSALGYHSTQVDSIFQHQGVLLITLKENPNFIHSKYLERSYYKNRGSGLYGLIDIVDEDFSAFESALGKENVYTLNRMETTFNMELAFMHERWHYGLLGGFLFTSNRDPDSIDIELNNSVFGLNLGYRVIDHERFFLMPNASFKAYKYRLINSDLRDDDQLEPYIRQGRDLDIRIWQPTAFLGATLAFKFDGKIKGDFQFWTLGLYGGYLLKLREKPHINGVRSSLNTDAKIEVNPFNFGLFISANFDPKGD
jgi:hypothetical protein